MTEAVKSCACCAEEPTEEELLERLDEVIAQYKGKPGALIPVLQLAQGIFGYLPEVALKHIARELRKPYSEVAGVVGFLFRRTGFSPAPLIMGLVLGGMVEETLKQSLIIFGDDLTGFLGRPIALVLFAVTTAGLLWPVVSRLLRVARARAA